MNYSEYLFTCLLKLVNKKFKKLEYDLQFKVGKDLYKVFENSDFNQQNFNYNEYDVIVEWLHINKKFISKYLKNDFIQKN